MAKKQPMTTEVGFNDTTFINNGLFAPLADFINSFSCQLDGSEFSVDFIFPPPIFYELFDEQVWMDNVKKAGFESCSLNIHYNHINDPYDVFLGGMMAPKKILWDIRVDMTIKIAKKSIEE